MSKNASFKDLVKALSTKRMLVVLLLGFSSGLPIMVVYGSLKLWLKRYDVDLSTIGYISWIAIPYSYNFLWAFFFDRFRPFRLGRRKSWLLITQAGLLISFILLSLGNPSESVSYIAFVGTLLCFFSASQDVCVDAYRNEILKKDELGIGASLGVYGYRIAMWVASGFGIWITDKETWNWSFNQMFMLMAALMFVGMLTTLWADEPAANKNAPKTLKDSVILPFLEFFKRKGAFFILLFIFLYKLGDSFAGSMTRPFYADIGFSNKTIGEIASTVGLFSTMLGLFIGGSIIYRYGYYASLWLSGILQALSTVCFAILAFFPQKLPFAGVVFFEDLASGMGTAALVALMGYLCNKRFTATQYALFASLASMSRTLLSGFAGDTIQYLQNNPVFFGGMPQSGYVNFYILGAALAFPGLIVLSKLKEYLNE